MLYDARFCLYYHWGTIHQNKNVDISYWFYLCTFTYLHTDSEIKAKLHFYLSYIQVKTCEQFCVPCLLYTPMHTKLLMLLFSDDYKEKGHLFYKNEWQKNENGAEKTTSLPKTQI